MLFCSFLVGKLLDQTGSASVADCVNTLVTPCHDVLHMHVGITCGLIGWRTYSTNTHFVNLVQQAQGKSS